MAKEKAKRDKQPGKRTWKIYDKAATTFAGLAAARAVDMVWRAAVGRKAPKNPSNPEVSWREAATWVALSGTAMQLAKMFATRRAADYWIRSTGHLPPGMKSLESTEKTPTPDASAAADGTEAKG
jgi:Protein of unknown function (DUF4235)